MGTKWPGMLRGLSFNHYHPMGLIGQSRDQIKVDRTCERKAARVYFHALHFSASHNFTFLITEESKMKKPIGLPINGE